MNINSRNLKLTIGAIYLIVLTTGLFFLFSIIDLKDLTSYEFIRSNKDQILEYKNNNFFFLSVTFFIFSIIWVLLLGFGLPLLLFAGFVFGKWWGIILIISSTTIGATLLYILAGLFFKDIIEQKLAPKFLKMKYYILLSFDLLEVEVYHMVFRMYCLFCSICQLETILFPHS